MMLNGTVSFIPGDARYHAMAVYLPLLLWGVFLYGFSRIIFPYFLTFFRTHGLVERNFKGDAVPQGTGLWISILYFASLPLVVYMVQPDRQPIFFFQLCAILALNLAGWVDDHHGSRKVKGIRAHFRSFYNGHITTGIIKAMVGSFIALCAVLLVPVPWYERVTGFLLLLLSINFMNLMDLRPGRVWKISLFLTGILLIQGMNLFISVLAMPLLVAAFFLFPLDMRGQLMLGDTGANAIGFLIGFWIFLFTSPLFQLGWLLFLILVHWYAERKSITRLIEQVPVLRRMDEWGRIS
ncbi:MAG: hypothetical protein H0Z33_00645 [Bacillaceae bacterium]|nr:hypothetical protein [Bacillaceae bacterium]